MFYHIITLDKKEVQIALGTYLLADLEVSYMTSSLRVMPDVIKYNPTLTKILVSDNASKQSNLNQK